MSRHHLLIYLYQAETEMDFLHIKSTFKMQITHDRHSPILVLKQELIYSIDKKLEMERS